MHVLQHRSLVSVILEPGEPILESLTKVVREKDMKGATLTGLGAIKDVELGFYDVEEQQYIRQTFIDDYELVSLHGNLSLKEDEPYLHVHIVMSDKAFNCKGGHLFEAKVAATVEIWLHPFGEMPVRAFDKRVGLHTICGLRDTK